MNIIWWISIFSAFSFLVSLAGLTFYLLQFRLFFGFFPKAKKDEPLRQVEQILVDDKLTNLAGCLISYRSLKEKLSREITQGTEFKFISSAEGLKRLRKESQRNVQHVEYQRVKDAETKAKYRFYQRYRAAWKERFVEHKDPKDGLKVFEEAQKQRDNQLRSRAS